MNDSTAPQKPAEAPSLYGGLISAQGLDLDRFASIQTQVQAWTTETGTTVKFVEARGLPIVDLILRFRAGSVQDTAQPGLAALTLYMLDEGSHQYTATQQAEHIERLGAIIAKQMRLEHATLSLRSLTTPAVLEPALALFTDLVANPAFTSSALEKIKKQLLHSSAARERRPELRARSEAFRHLFRGHPYGRPLGVTEEGVAAVTPDDLRVFHQRAYCASNLEMVVVGDLSLAEAQALSRQVSQALPQGWTAIDLPAVPAATPATISIEQPGTSSAVLLALPLNLPANDPQFPALVLASDVLGEGLESRLMVELRERRGLTYGVYSHLSPLRAGGLFTVEWEIAPAHVEGTEELVMTVLRDFIEQGPTEAELQLARKQLEGQLLRGVAQNRRLAALLAELSHQRQPDNHLNTYIERINSLSPADVRAAMQRHLDLSYRVKVNVGPSVEQQPLPAPDQ
ncbi:insulinase family protein [Pseudomonas vlassakiae]|jgi:zinc protease|uniref:M16 family metallopeptidase n=1 Tax=Pseudomonas TaxID=286 RepID=UPI0006D3E3D4|nr:MULTISPECIES: pitrilysin family protein [Pseudomonas]AXQ46395.1 insulinase family protein [Stenotrophomonas rhizophila]MBS3188061.1 insulinase family protein [Pseudomonas sp. PCH44]MCU0122481.1 insulinase family protein [Pseudomonas vlassakiae]PIK78666.1 insulinase family protein [Pseudomonas sp. 382]